jgi:hypothetical protein
LSGKAIARIKSESYVKRGTAKKTTILILAIFKKSPPKKSSKKRPFNWSEILKIEREGNCKN